MNGHQNDPTGTAAGIMLRSQKSLGEKRNNKLFSPCLLKSSQVLYNHKDMNNKKVNSGLNCNSDYYKQVRNSFEVDRNIDNTKTVCDSQEYSEIDPSSRRAKNDKNMPLKNNDLQDSNRTADINVGISVKCVLPSENNFKKPGGLKLTLRMKRSSCFREVMESGSNLIHDYFQPEYEVFKLEGVDNASHISYSRKKKRPKYEYSKFKRQEHMKSEEKSFFQRPLKRLRLILGNESHTINFPSTVTNCAT